MKERLRNDQRPFFWLQTYEMLYSLVLLWRRRKADEGRGCKQGGTTDSLDRKAQNKKGARKCDNE